MFDKSQSIFTYTLNGNVINVITNNGITAIALLLISGTGTYKGNKKLGALDSTATSLVIGRSVTISAEQSKYIEDLVIDGTGGVIEIIAR